MLMVKAIGKSKHEFQLGTELEEGQIEVATGTDFKEKVGAFQLQDVAFATRKVNHRIESHQRIGANVAVSLRCSYEVEGTGDVGGFDILDTLVHQAPRRLLFFIVYICGISSIGGRIVVERHVAHTKVHGRSHTELEIFVQTELS